MSPITIDICRWSTPHPATYLTRIVYTVAEIESVRQSVSNLPVSNMGTSNAAIEDKKTAKKDRKRPNGILGDHVEAAAMKVVNWKEYLLILVSFQARQFLTHRASPAIRCH